MGYTNKDICEIVAREVGFNAEIKNCNLGEWYGFSNEGGEIARFKVSVGAGADEKRYYSFAKGALAEGVKIYITINDSKNFAYKEICTKDFNQSNPSKYSIKEIEIQKNDFKHLIWSETIIESIKSINSVNKAYNRILSRTAIVDKEAISLLINTGEQKCFYCGITKDQIDELEEASKNDELNLKWHHKDGLTKRQYRKNS